MSLLRVGAALLVLLAALVRPASAANVAGTTADPSGSPIESAHVSLLNLATGAEQFSESDRDGRFTFEGLPIGIYKVAVARDGYSDDSRTVSIADAGENLALTFVLRPGGLTANVTVTATRSERDPLEVPLVTDTINREEILRANPASTGDALVQLSSVTPVGSGPYGSRPRLRGLDSTRLLVLVDGERLNNARTATDRAGIEVGLVDLATVESMEVVSGSGSVLYGTDALAGTINLLTNQPVLSDTLRFLYGFDGYLSSNDSGRRGALTFGASSRRFSAQVIGGLESFDNYHAGGDGHEDTGQFFASGQLRQADTIDDLGFNFKAFPDPFNAPFVRTGTEIPASASDGNNLNASALFEVTNTQTLRFKYIRRRVEDVGFPDFAQPAFFQEVTLPFSELDRFSARYEVRALTPWFSNLKIATYYQDQDRLLRNRLPVQFSTGAARLPISVFRLNIVSDTEQRVRTPGLDVQGTFLFAPKHVVTAGTTIYADRSADARTTTTETTMIGNVTPGAFGPQANVFPAPVVLGLPAVSHPTRVPDARFRDVGLFGQDEWALAANLKVVLGLRYDNYRVTTDSTAGYDPLSQTAGATPPIDPSTLPNPNGDRISRNAVTGDAGIVYRVNDQVSVLGHYGRSYRHPNLEELLFSGSATVGAIAPNVNVEPETGDNIDVGVKVRNAKYSASMSYFNNRFNGFISTEIVAIGPSGPLSQAINLADVRIQGLEGDGQVPLTFRGFVVTPFGNFAYNRGSILEGTNLLTNTSLDGTAQDNISPLKLMTGVRFSDVRGRFWIEYGNRHQAEVERVAVTLEDSPFLIAQDLLSLDGFTVQRLAWGLTLRPQTARLGVTFAIENLGNVFYREQFQFAPARGRAFTVGFNIRGN